ncbi:hypothetical protein HDU76_007717 [Blyttiomyces sp. JEL0837]|nr:hypothetical protein HDU76_007717 [Blyttiomyces sp. JEL0837]
MSSIASKAVETATNVAQSAYNRVDPYVPQVAKDAATYAAQTASSTAAFAYNATYDTTVKTVGAAVEYTTNTATAVKDGVVNTATGAVTYAKDTTFWAINGATTTITAYTPGPIKSAINSTLAGATALRQDPVGTVKPYVPTFIIHTGEKTYEIVVNTTEKTKEGVQVASGMVYTKVNGTIEYVTSIPQIHSLIEKLNSLASPVLNKIRGTKLPAPAAEAEAEVNAAAAAEE